MKQSIPVFIFSVCLLGACGGGGSSSSGGVAPVADSSAAAPPRVTFQKFPIRDPQLSAAFIDVEDLNSDGIKEVILSTLIEVNAGPPNASSRGALRIFETTSGSIEGPWSENTIISTIDAQNGGEGWPFINTPQVYDVDQDGIKDIVVQTGFLLTNGGAHFVMRGASNDNLVFEHADRFHFATPETRKETSDNYYWHESEQTDLDGDGLLDIVTTSGQTQRPTNPTGGPVCEEQAQPNGRCAELKVEWYRNTGTLDPLTGQPVFIYHRIAPQFNVGGVFIKLHDIDSDGDQDIALSQFFGPPVEPSIVWLENVEAPSAANSFAGVWALHAIDSTIGLGYHMEFVDINNDGNIDLVAGNHNNQADPRLQLPEGTIFPGLFWFEIPDDPRNTSQWVKHDISGPLEVTTAGSPPSQGVPGIFNVGDINDDGLLDVAVPGDGNDDLYAYIQNSDGNFVEYIVDTATQFGMAIVADIDGDGSNEIIAAQHNSQNGEMGVEFPPGMLSVYKYTEETEAP